jgi:4-hydroxybenzoyl-CoA thioesterase
MLINRRQIQIEWGDCDAAGTVFFPRYLEYGDACTNALFARAGLFKPFMLKTYNIIGVPLVDLRARFVVPSNFGDEVVYETSIPEWGRSSFLVQHRVLLPDGVLGLEIFERRVWVVRVSEDPVKFRSEPIPEEVKKRFTDPVAATGIETRGPVSRSGA